MSNKPSISQLIQAAEQGDAAAQYKLARAYAYGDGVTKDRDKEVILYRKAAELGNPDAMYKLAFFHSVGFCGVQEDKTKANDLYRKAAAGFHQAAEQGNADAQLSLCECYMRGRGVAKNIQQAIMWLRKAAKQGNCEAMYWLGSLYDEGKEVAQDHEQAAKWWLKASAQGDTDAQFSLGELYRLGKGRPQDNKMAYIWYSVSTIDNNEAVRARDDLERLLTPADLIDAQTLTQRYIKRRISEETQ